MDNHKPLVLIVLDGWGYRQEPEYNAILAAHTPNWDHLWQTYLHTLISGSGQEVGLPNGQMGNSEVGHLHMGAGRLVPQDLMRLDQDISSGDFFNNPILNAAMDAAQGQNSAVHILGLLSPGGVHSHESHILALAELAARKKITKLYLHAILDGRDTPPRSALASLAKLQKQLKERGGQLISLIGRYYAMDRDQRWDRVKKAYDLYTLGSADYHAKSAADGLEMAYERDEGDEFVAPTSIDNSEHPIAIDDNDVVFFMNFRADRARQLTRAFTEQQFTGFKRKKWPKLAKFVTLTQYATTITADVAYPPLQLKNVFGEYIANNNLSQLRIAETEKYAHVTFFFNGGREQPFEKEDRILIPSPQVLTYDLQPEMSAPDLTRSLIKVIEEKKYDVIICNFANADMVGHSGNFAATIKAIETIDTCLGKIVAALLKVGGEAIITADHGNAELMYDVETKQPHTAHTTQLVPFIYIGREAKIVPHPSSHQGEEEMTSQKEMIGGTLVDIAPTMLHVLGLPVPKEMTGKSLLEIKE